MQNVVKIDGKVRGLGWHPEPPDRNDYNENHPKIEVVAKRSGAYGKTAEAISSEVDLSDRCFPIRNQRNIGSCTAFSYINHIRSQLYAAYGKQILLSPRYLYKNTRRLLGWEGDTGAYVRTTIKSGRLLGVALEENWEYDIERFDEDIVDGFIYGIAENFEATNYFRHDIKPLTQSCVLMSIRKWMSSGHSCVGGFYGFGSFNYGDKPGYVPVPSENESARWGHAVHFCGYDDNLEIKNTKTGERSKGAFMFENSWGANWGQDGFGWLPYEYVLNRWMRDIWTVVNSEWVDLSVF